MKGQHAITKSKVFNFDNYLVPKSLDTEHVRSSIQLEKQQDYLHSQYPIDSQHTAMPTLLPNKPSTMPVMISSKVSPSATPKAFSISELMRKDEKPYDSKPHMSVVNNPVSSTQGVTVLKQQNINININDGRQSLVLFGGQQPPNLIRHSESNKSNQGFLLIPASSNGHAAPSQSAESAFSKYQPLVTHQQHGYYNNDSWNSQRMSGTSHIVTGTRSSSVAKIRFADSNTEIVSGRTVKSEPTTPTPGSPSKKSILKRQSNDGMEKYALFTYFITFTSQ